MPILTEKQVDQKIVRWFKENCKGGVCIKIGMVGAHGSAGWPDRLFLYCGLGLFVEMKAPGKRPTPLQQARHDELRRAGAMVLVASNPEEAIDYMEGFFR
jgi:hypothetical protein